MIKKVGAGFLFLVIIIIAALGGVIGTAAVDEFFPAPSPDPDAEIISPTGFRRAHQKAYIEGCIKSGSNQAHCDCSFNKFKEIFKPEELKELVMQYKTTGLADQRIDEVMTSCACLR